MMHLDTTWVIVAGELYLALLVGFLVLVFFHFRKRRQDRNAAMALVSAVKQTTPERQAATCEWLQAPLGNDEAAVHRAANEILRAEKVLVQRVVSMYLKRDAAALSQFQADVTAAGEPQRRLLAAVAGLSPAAMAAANEEMQRVQEENSVLRQELQITMETMSRMLGEYSAMFGGGEETRDEAHTLNDMLEDQEQRSSFANVSLDDLQEISATDLSREWDDDKQPGSDKGIDLADTSTKPAQPVKHAIPPKPLQTGNQVLDDDLADLWVSALSEQGHKN